jgi:hypothetical protein
MHVEFEQADSPTTRQSDMQRTSSRVASLSVCQLLCLSVVRFFQVSSFKSQVLSFVPNPITSLITQLENPAHLNLDELLNALRDAARSWDDLHLRLGFCECELQKELKAVVELIGPIPACTDPNLALQITGENLVRARRDARRRYNDLFRISPIRRQN